MDTSLTSKRTCFEAFSIFQALYPLIFQTCLGRKKLTEIELAADAAIYGQPKIAYYSTIWENNSEDNQSFFLMQEKYSCQKMGHRRTNFGSNL